MSNKPTRGRPTARSFQPKTPYQEWFEQVTKDKSVEIKELAEQVGYDYSHLWKILRGDPEKYPSSARPGYSLAAAIGDRLGDRDGSIRAASFALNRISDGMPDGSPARPGMVWVTLPQSGQRIEIDEQYWLSPLRDRYIEGIDNAMLGMNRMAEIGMLRGDAEPEK